MRWFRRYLVHVEGRWAGMPFEPLDWQLEILVSLFGWVDDQGLRQYRRAYIEIPRKNGKSTFGAGLALYLLCADGEQGAQVYSVAADREQASIVFRTAKAMIAKNPTLASRLEPLQYDIRYTPTLSRYRALSSDAPSKHGFSSHAIIFDELHAQPNRDLWDVMSTSTAARTQPLLISFTTAGFDQTDSVCWEQHEYTRKVVEGVIDDPTHYGVIHAAERDDDWQDPEVWKKANPSLGVTIPQTYLETECLRAVDSPAYQNSFRRLHLNQWTAQRDRWLDLAAWDRCGQELPDLQGRPCYAGLDLASTTDLTALVLVFPPVEALPETTEPFWVLPFFWLPEEAVRKHGRTEVPYQAWIDAGLIETTQGDVTDYDAILLKLAELQELYQILEVAFDRWGSQKIVNDLDGLGLVRIDFGQGYASMSAPTKELLRCVLSQALQHGANPVLRWNADNLVVRMDPAGNVKPDKEKSSEKIDGIVALVMALGRATARAAEAKASIYEGRGVLRL